MCFTIEVHLTRKAIEKRFAVDTASLNDFDFNYFYRAFTNPLIPVIAGDSPHTAQLMQWGLIPSWAKNSQKASEVRKGTYNARAETLHEKPSFKEALLKGRYIKGARIPWYIRLKNEAPFAFAGLFDSWRNPDSNEIIQSFSIVTTGANPLMERIHNTKKRMPVILSPENEKEWISGDISLHKARQLLLPLDENEMHAHVISPSISKIGADPADSSLIKAIDYQETGSLF